MNQNLQEILRIIQQSEQLDAEQKESLLKAVKDADKELEITAFKLERTEKVKKTTAILLEETIEELEQKRKAVEAQNRELEIETALEKVRSSALAMKQPADMVEVCRIISDQLQLLKVKDIRNIQTAIINEVKGIYLNYEYFTQYKTTSTLEIEIKLHPTVIEFVNEIQKSNDAFFTKTFEGEALQDWREYRRKTNQNVDPILDEAKSVHYYFYSIGPGALGISTYAPLSEEDIAVFRRFRNVFELAYRRFIDIELAITQAREAQIETALERVRSRTMAMQYSDELKEAAALLFQQVQKLGVKPWSCGYCIWNKDKTTVTAWMSPPQGGIQPPIILPMKGTSNLHVLEAHQRGENFFVQELSGKALEDEYNFLISEVPGFKELVSNSKKAGFSLPTFQVYHTAFFSQGYLLFITIELCPEVWDIFKRFAKVFEQTYTRFLDLQKAEAQAREAKIEASLEKVRSNAMAMHNSNDISSTTTAVFEELGKLNIKSKRCGIALLSGNSFMGHVYAAATSSEGKFLTLRRSIDMTQHQSLQQQYESWKKQENYFIEMNGDELKSYYQLPFFYSSPDYVPPTNYERTEYGYYIPFSEGLFYAWTESPYSEIEINILNRFKSIIDLTFRRYFDLKKAEAQAREAQIETTLEKVRSRSLAMHKSDELLEVITVVSEQLKHLGFRFDHVSFAVNNQVHDYNFWISFFDHPTPYNIFVPYLDNPMFERAKQAQQEGLSFYSDILTPEENRHWHKHVFEQNNFDFLNEKLKQYIYKGGFARSIAFLPNIMLIIGNYASRSYSDEENDIISRFAKVFDQTYTRFLDLQKAEAQTREAQIEAALERVRAKAMAMNSSEDFVATVATFYHELSSLSHTPRRCGVGLIDKETRVTELSTFNTTDEGESIEVIGKIKLEGHPVLSAIYDNWLIRKEYHPVLKGNKIKEYYHLIRPQISIPDYSNDQVQYGYFFYFNEGGVYTWTEKELSEDELQIYRRFTSVLSLTHRRYLDIQEAEARAIEAVKQSSLDRIRAQIASMRTTDDLNHITPIIWHELEILKVPFFRCGVFIVDEQNGKVQVYLTTPDGKSLGVLNLFFESNELTSNTVDHWRKKQVYKEHWNKQEFINWTQSMVKLGQVQNAETYQGSSTPPESLHLHFVPFTQGMLYVGDISPLTDEKLDLVKTLAEAFSIAYARYEDFKNLEEAKNKVELTLKELKSAQVQLIHSEKMASLGELTAGIAHEIKNPLNFVNNFSEISGELLDEMKTELENKNNEEVIELIENLKQNLEKINQHGKRADSIVKGMLLHSRGSSGEKTLTDINDLLDQYVNLAYHGMRAQNKEFNITIEKDYDKTLEKINVIPQDLSRVFLNIINNACYAAYDKKKKNSDNNFSPTLSVSTKNLDGKVEIRIGDNGDGIPASILDKIFNPFFTTKPTGEGTGLGLSLSYDIITKVHSGELKVETKEGEGTEMIIILSLNM